MSVPENPDRFIQDARGIVIVKRGGESTGSGHKLSQSTIEKLGYYVYLLIDPRTGLPFYVGKGCGNRINQHLLGALKTNTHEKEKIQTIHDIQAKGLGVGLVVLRHGLAEKEAFEVEGAMIDFLGKEGLTNIVSGHHATDRGLMKLEDIKIKYEAEDAIFSDPVILININKLYRPNMTLTELYEATRKHWKVSIRRASRIKIACSVYRGIIRGVFTIHRWLPTPERRRSYFEGEDASQEIRDKYLHKSVAKYWKQGSQSPIKYEG